MPDNLLWSIKISKPFLSWKTPALSLFTAVFTSIVLTYRYRQTDRCTYSYSLCIQVCCVGLLKKKKQWSIWLYLRLLSRLWLDIEITKVLADQVDIVFKHAIYSFFFPPRAFFTTTGFWLFNRALALLTAAWNRKFKCKQGLAIIVKKNIYNLMTCLYNTHTRTTHRSPTVVRL